MKKKVFAALNLLLVVFVCLANRRYILQGTLRFKGEASFCFVLLGAVNMLYALAARAKPLYPASMLAGLVLAMAGDILIGKNFVLGAALFAGGHLLYFVSCCVLRRPQRMDFLPIAAVFAVSALLVLCTPGLSFDPPVLRWVCLGYAAVISCMTGKALSNWIHARTGLNLLLVIGSALFYFSDLMLLLDWFAGMDVGVLCLATYYPAQALLAASAFDYTTKECLK